MEPKKDISDFDLDALDLEIFSSTYPTTTKKRLSWQDQLNKTYIKIGLTLFLLLFLFGSTFFIASRIAKPTFTTSSADVGYIPQAQIDIPSLPTSTPQAAKSCSDINNATNSATFLHSFCQGNICNSQSNKETCESIDVVTLKDGVLSEESGQDGILDCVWIEEEAICKPKY